jgi:hypothetical protein
MAPAAGITGCAVSLAFLAAASALAVCGFFWLRRLNRLYEAEADRDARWDREHASPRPAGSGDDGEVPR